MIEFFDSISTHNIWPMLRDATLLSERSVRIIQRATTFTVLFAFVAACSSSKEHPSDSKCAGITCTAIDDCHVAGICDQATGFCSNPTVADGTACATGTCRSGACITESPLTCGNGTKDDDETDVDCGGVCSGCVDAKVCNTGDDCMSESCVGNHCAENITELAANPGLDRSVISGAHVILDGTRSRSPVGDITTWSWTQTGGPTVQLTAADTAHPSFDAPQVDETGALLTFTLTVKDGSGASATKSFQVELYPSTWGAATTGTGLILSKMSDGSLDREQAVQYLAFALFGDPRLPTEYQGTINETCGTGTMHIILEEFSTLSPAAQEVIRPFLLPPNDPGSWYSKRFLQSQLLQRTAIRSAAVSGDDLKFSDPVLGDDVAIWYRKGLADGLTKATALRDEIESTIWPALLAVWHSDHMPILDITGIKWYKYKPFPGKLNIYLINGLIILGKEQPYLKNTPSPTYIELDENLPLQGTENIFWEAAHEIMHACQDSYSHYEEYDNATKWLYDGTAHWAADYIYPNATSPNLANVYLDNMERPLDSWYGKDEDLHPYATYLFFKGETSGYVPDNTPGKTSSGWPPCCDLIRRSFENFQTQRSLYAVSNAFSDGMSQHWKPFLEAAWDRDPTNSYPAIKGLQRGAKPEETREVNMNAPDVSLNMDATVQHLAAKYHEFKFTDPNARSIFFYDGLSNPIVSEVVDDGNTTLKTDWSLDPNQEARTTALVLMFAKRNEAWNNELVNNLDWRYFGELAYCQDDPASHVDELTIAFGDPTPQTGHVFKPKGLNPILRVSNIGCYKWVGTVTAYKNPNHMGPLVDMTADVTWEKPTSLMNPYPVAFTVTQGTVTWKISGSFAGCVYSGSGSWSLDPNDTVLTGLAFNDRVISGPLYRTYSGAGVSAKGVNVQIQCGDTINTIEYYLPNWFKTVRLTDQTWLPKVSDDGTLAEDTADDGSMVYNWSFHSVAGQ